MKVITTITTEEIDEIHLYNNSMNHNNSINNYQHNFNDNCFGAIQEEKMPSNTCQPNSTTMSGNCLKVQNELMHQPSSSSSSSSLNNQNNMRTNNSNCKNLNYGSSISNATTG